MSDFPIKCRKEERPAALANAFLMARGKLSDPFIQAGSVEAFGALYPKGSVGLAHDAMMIPQRLGGLAASLFEGAFPGGSVCFAAAPKVDVYLFEADGLTICAKVDYDVFEWGWARGEEIAGLGAQASEREKELLLDALVRLGASLAMAFPERAGLRKGPLAGPSSIASVAPYLAKMMESGQALAPLLAARSEARELERESAPAEPSGGGSRGLRV